MPQCNNNRKVKKFKHLVYAQRVYLIAITDKESKSKHQRKYEKQVQMS